jgi:hypothetical protein
LSELVTAGQLAANEDWRPAVRIEPPTRDREPNRRTATSLASSVFTSAASRRRCYHYGVELHNFTPNAILQSATFVGVWEGFLGIPVNWDLWVHLFRAELHTLATP